MFILGYSIRPAMVTTMGEKGAKYPSACRGADGDHRIGDRSNGLPGPAEVPGASGLANAQPSSSSGWLDDLTKNDDGLVDLVLRTRAARGSSRVERAAYGTWGGGRSRPPLLADEALLRRQLETAVLHEETE
jgi:hypothetical protein